MAHISVTGYTVQLHLRGKVRDDRSDRHDKRSASADGANGDGIRRRRAAERVCRASGFRAACVERATSESH